MSNMFQDLSKLVYAANEGNRLALKSYFEKYDLFNESNLVIVDVGWLLNIQSRLDRFIKQFSKTKVIGCYVGSRNRINKNITHSSLLFDCGDPFVYSNFLEENTTLFEVLFSSPEASAKSLQLNDDGEVSVAFKKLDTPLSSEFVIAQKLHMGAEAFFKCFKTAREDFFPEQISRDYFFYLFEALVETENDLAKANLGNFEVKLGGHHEFLVHEQLINKNTNVEYKLKQSDEYFDPIFYKVDGCERKFIIITSAGLDNGSTRYRAMNLAMSLQNKGIGSILAHSTTSIEKFEELVLDVDNVVFQRCFEGQGNTGKFFTLSKQQNKKMYL